MYIEKVLEVLSGSLEFRVINSEDKKKHIRLFRQLEVIYDKVLKTLDSISKEYHIPDVYERYKKLSSICSENREFLYSKLENDIVLAFILWKIYWYTGLKNQDIFSLKNIRKALELSKDYNNLKYSLIDENIIEIINTSANAFIWNITPVGLFCLFFPLIDLSNAEEYLIEGEKALLMMQIESMIKYKNLSEKLLGYERIITDIKNNSL